VLLLFLPIVYYLLVVLWQTRFRLYCMWMQTCSS